jgi:hypothetical protein
MNMKVVYQVGKNYNLSVKKNKHIVQWEKVQLEKF